MDIRPTELWLDLAKEPAERQTVFVREGEVNATAIEAHVYDHGERAALDGLTATFYLRHPKGTLLEDVVGEVSGSEIAYTLTAHAAEEVGLCDVAYFSLEDAEGNVRTTEGFAVLVLPNAQTDGNGIAAAYSSRIEELLEWCRSTFEADEAERQAATDATIERAAKAADSIEQAIKGALDPLFAEYLSLTIVPITDPELDGWWGGDEEASGS